MTANVCPETIHEPYRRTFADAPWLPASNHPRSPQLHEDGSRSFARTVPPNGYEITREKQAITPSVALRVAKMTGTKAEMWLEMQQAHDLALARTNSCNLLEKVPQLEERW